MSTSVILKDTAKSEKTPASANAHAAMPLISGAEAGVASKATMSAAPESVSSAPTRPPGYNPLLALATLLEQECFGPESTVSSSRGNGFQKSLLSSVDTSTSTSTSSENGSQNSDHTLPKKKTKPLKTKKRIKPTLPTKKNKAKHKPSPPKKPATPKFQAKKKKRDPDELIEEAKSQVLAWNINKRGNDGRIVEAAWNKNYEVLVKYYAENGDSNVPRSYHNKQLSGWVKRQRNNLKDGKLSSNQIVLLNNLDFVWNRTDGQWYKKFCCLVRFQQKFGHCYVTAKYDRSLAEWTQRQRREYKTRPSKISEERLRKLEALEGWSWEKLKEQAPERHIEFEREMDEIERLEELERQKKEKEEKEKKEKEMKSKSDSKSDD